MKPDRKIFGCLITESDTMKLKDIMVKDAVSVKLPGNRTDLLKLLVKNNLTGVPVVNDDGTLDGFVTRQDIYAKPDEEQLALVMRKDYPTLEPKDTVEAGAKLMLENDLHHLPIVQKGKLVGIVTNRDGRHLGGDRDRGGRSFPADPLPHHRTSGSASGGSKD